HELGIVPTEEIRQLADRIGRGAVLDTAASPGRRSATIEGPAAEPGNGTASRVERKQVTVLRAWICRADDPDAEATVEHVDPQLSVISEAAARFGGTLSQVGDDGGTALCGAPVAQEDPEVRACRAALAMRDAIASSPTDELDLRTAIHSGEAIVRGAGDE